MNRVLPGARWIRLDGTHPIFDSFFRIEQIDLPHPSYHHLFGRRPEYFGLFEDNDPTRHLMAIATTTPTWPNTGSWAGEDSSQSNR